MKRAWSLATHWAHREDWSDWADAQADLSLRRAHMPLYWFWHEAVYSLVLCDILSLNFLSNHYLGPRVNEAYSRQTRTAGRKNGALVYFDFFFLRLYQKCRSSRRKFVIFSVRFMTSKHHIMNLWYTNLNRQTNDKFIVKRNKGYHTFFVIPILHGTCRT